MLYIVKNHFSCKKLLLLAIMTCLWCWSLITSADGINQNWLLVDLSGRRLILYSDENREIGQFDDISIGRGGVSQLHIQGDQTTPVGDYFVTHINLDSRYKAFIGLNYPTADHAKKAFLEDRISRRELKVLLYAARTKSIPPSNTALGGMIGIHALGMADPEVHKIANWTQGCVALNNEQMDELLPYIREGMRVVIR